MREAGRYLDFTAKTLGSDGRAKVLVQDLNGDLSLMTDVASEEDCRHSALSQLTLYVVAITESSFQLFEQLIQIRISIWRPVPKDTIECNATPACNAS